MPLYEYEDKDGRSITCDHMLVSEFGEDCPYPSWRYAANGYTVTKETYERLLTEMRDRTPCERPPLVLPEPPKEPEPVWQGAGYYRVAGEDEPVLLLGASSKEATNSQYVVYEHNEATHTCDWYSERNLKSCVRILTPQELFLLNKEGIVPPITPTQSTYSTISSVPPNSDYVTISGLGTTVDAYFD